ncbi:MAG: cysteine desulfurase family protein [Gemmatimonadota bacterium]
MPRIYLDHAATTPVRAEVRDAMAPYLHETFGNPSSLHAEGRSARSALEDARDRVGGTLGVPASTIRFVRGGTESDNLAILGRADRARGEGRAPLVAVSAVEHRAVLEAAAAVEDRGGELIHLPVDRSGGMDEGALESALEREADLVSVMWVNNEVGIQLPVEEIATRCRDAGVCIHTDAVQAVGHVPVDLAAAPVDLLTATGHKIYGPKSTGILYVRDGVELSPRLFGGGQESGVRPGTQDVAGAVGMAVALESACRERDDEAERLAGLRNDLERRLTDTIPDLRIHGEHAPRAPHISNVGIPGVELDTLLVALDLAGVAVSSGSACSSGAVRASHVLTALYGDEVGSMATLRFSLGRETGEEEIRSAAAIVVSSVNRVRSTAA